MGERELKSRVVSLSLTLSEYMALVEEAAELSLRLKKHVTIQEVIRRIIREHLERRGRKGEGAAGRAG